VSYVIKRQPLSGCGCGPCVGGNPCPGALSGDGLSGTTLLAIVGVLGAVLVFDIIKKGKRHHGATTA
jgi:hypothetical protein